MRFGRNEETFKYKEANENWKGQLKEQYHNTALIQRGSGSGDDAAGKGRATYEAIRTLGVCGGIAAGDDVRVVTCGCFAAGESGETKTGASKSSLPSPGGGGGDQREASRADSFVTSDS